MFEDLQNLWAGLIFIGGWIGGFFVWLRGLLRKRPPIQAFQSQGLTFWQSVRTKFAFLKTKLLAGFLTFASAAVFMYDFAVTIAASIDWHPVQSLLPPWAWPLIWFVIAAVFYWLRHVTTKETERVIAAVERGVPAEEAILMAGQTPNRVERGEV